MRRIPRVAEAGEVPRGIAGGTYLKAGDRITVRTSGGSQNRS